VASTYIRMAQPHGGESEGHHFPLRKGTEVMVAFSGGDPDRPLISGVVPNATHPSTVTSVNHTYNVMRTGGGNYIIMDDDAGKQSIELYTPIFACSRIAGWAAHITEQHDDNRLIRPKGIYQGAKGLKYVPVEER
ncbi:MAG: citrate/2-methylcitrate synthase, partial [Candidatus Hydrothermarchaeota archaeon]